MTDTAPGAALAIPDPLTQVVPQGWGLALLDKLDGMDDLGAINGGRATLAGHVAAYKAKRVDATELIIGERVAEIRIGELLPEPPGPGRPPAGEIAPASAIGLDRSRQSEFRRLAEHREDVLGWLKGGTVGRAALLALIAAKQAGYEMPPIGDVPLCAVIYADPPWLRNHNVGSRAAENHYTTMTTEEIAALVPPAADDAVLFLWATPAMLMDACTVMAAWQFKYQTGMVWVKDKIGPGWYVRGQHELLLIGTRGDLPTPGPADRPSSVVTAPRGEHSAKPEVFYEIIERMYPGLPRAELFARTRREGWAQWGHEASGNA